jgi:hypothetical protein
MSPDDYFPDRYLADVDLIGTDGTICSATIGRILRGHVTLEDPDAYFCSAYVMLIIDQGLHSHSSDSHAIWKAQTTHIPNFRGCSMRHGGMMYPKDLMRFCTLPKDKLYATLDYFFQCYLPKIGISGNVIANFKVGLAADPDCPELHSYFGKV